MLWSIIFVALIAGFLILTPPGQAFVRWCIAQQKKQIAEQRQAKEKLEQNLLLFQQNPSSPDLPREIIKSLKELSTYNLVEAPKTREVIELLLISRPQDVEIQNYASEKIKRGMFRSQEAYAMALRILEHHPSEPKAKQFVLDIGRWHFAKIRGGKVTIYDEQAIQNDISVRSR
jgi:hypothetical protein